MNQPQQHKQSEQAERLLRKAHSTILLRSSATIWFRSLLIVITGFTALLLVEHLWYLSPINKMLILLVILSTSTFSFWNSRKQKKKIPFQLFYRQFSRISNLPELKDALDLESSNEGNRALIDAAILQSLQKIKPEKLKTALDKYLNAPEQATTYKQFRWLTVSASLVFLITIVNFGDAGHRMITFWESYQKPNPYEYQILPGNITVEQGSPFQVKITFNGENPPKDVALKVKTSVEEEFRTRVMEMTDSAFTSIPQDLNDHIQYYVEMDGYRSEVFEAEVQLRPRFNHLQAVINPPEYTRLDSTVSTYPVSQIRAYEGSQIRLSGHLNKQISHLQLSSSDEFIDLFVQPDSTFSFEFLVEKKDTLNFHIEDESGLTNKNPFQLIITPSKDEYPLAELIEPEQSYSKINPENIQLLYRATDDFDLTSSSLHYELRRAYVESPQSGKIDLTKPENRSLQGFDWNLTDLTLKPQDELTFWIEVRDNDGYNGYKTSESRRVTLTIPSLVDYFENVDRKENEIESDLDDVSESFKQTEEQYERFKERMKDNPENPGYEEKRELDQLQQQQEEVQKKIDELNSKFEELKKELSQDNMLSEETRQAYEELQKLMKEIDDPAFREAIEKMREQLGEMNPEQLRQAMEELEFNEELYKQRLERTIELFKQLKLNSDLDKLAKSFDDMARKQEEQVDGEDSANATAEQEQTKKELEENEKLSEQVESLSDNTSQKNEKLVKEYQEKTREELQQLMEELQQELEKEDSQKTEGSQNQSQPQNEQSKQQRYQKLAEMTRSLMEGMQQQQLNVNIAGLQYVLYSLLTLSIEQEDLTTLASGAENRSQAYVTYARDQRNVESIFKSLSDSLYHLSSEIPQFSNKINEKKLEVEKRLQRSLEQMSERNRGQSSVASRQALGGINDISFMIANLLENLQNSKNSNNSGGGMSMQQMMENLQQSGQQQQQLNQQLQEMINDMQGERLSQDQMERLNQIAKQQNQIRKQLQELQRNGEMGGDKIGSELERMIEEMEDTINDLRGGSTDPVMIERQQNILSRMLQAEKALQERDEEEKREGDAAEQYEQSRPPELTLEELEKEIRNRLNDPNFTKYSPDYQRLIEYYFELLKQIEGTEIQ